MTVIERIGRQILPILVCAGAIGFLAPQLGKDFMNPDVAGFALFFCGVIAAGIQMCGALFSSKRRNLIVGVCDATIIVATLAVFLVLPAFLEYIVKDETMDYDLYPGPNINAISVLVTAAALVVLAFFPKTKAAVEPQTVQEKAHVSVAERIGRQVLPILVCVWGLSFLFVPQWFDGDFDDRTFAALLICGIVAPWVQMVATLLVGKQRRASVITFDAAALLAALALLELIPAFADEVLKVDYTIYLLDGGLQANIVAAGLITAAVVALAFVPGLLGARATAKRANSPLLDRPAAGAGPTGRSQA